MKIWTDKGQVRMLPSEIDSFFHTELENINHRVDRIRKQGYQYKIQCIQKCRQCLNPCSSGNRDI